MDIKDIFWGAVSSNKIYFYLLLCAKKSEFLS